MNAVELNADFERMAQAMMREGAAAYHTVAEQERVTHGGGYENAPATRMLATHCAACGRPLVDAVSVEAAMGPDCREKYGYAADVPEAVRAEANRLVFEIATGNSSLALALAAQRIEALGLPRLAKRVLERSCRVRITTDGKTLTVVTPYSESSVMRLRLVPGRRWDKERKVNTFPCTQRAALFEALKACFSGEVALGPKGVFEL